MPRILPASARGRSMFWLVDIEWAGATVRLSDTETDVVKEDGTVLRYVAALDKVDAAESFDFLSDASSSPTSIAIDAVLPVDVPALVAKGHDLATAKVTVARWASGTTYESRRIVVVGSAVDPEYGATDEPVSLSVEATPWDDSATIPWQRVTTETFDADMVASLPGSGRGVNGPIVIGTPGLVSSAVSANGRLSASNGVYFDQRNDLHTHITNVGLMVAGHHVAAESVYLLTTTDTTPYRYHVVNTHDRAGNPIAICPWWWTKSPATADDMDYDSGATYTWRDATANPIGSIGHNATPSSIQPDPAEVPAGTLVVWRDEDDLSRGGLADGAGKTIRGAGDVLEYLLGLSGIPVDRGRFAAVAPLLNGYKLDLVIEESVTPWEYIRASILPLLPVSIGTGPDGLYPILWRHDATAADAIVSFNADNDPLVERASTVSYDRSSILNDITLEYAYSIRTDGFCAALRYTAAEFATAKAHSGLANAEAVPSLLCTLSQARYRRADGSPLVASKTVQGQCIYDDATAHKVLQWMTAAYALARRRVSYVAPEAEYGWASPGDIATVTDASVSLAGAVAMVERIRTAGSSRVVVDLLLVDSPVRDTFA